MRGAKWLEGLEERRKGKVRPTVGYFEKVIADLSNETDEKQRKDKEK
ncbi:hypothetical protein M1295_01390 [Patescibacteria group bacterium]|nr:hypothetical protein [Patescibacteria group bacterium]